MGRRRRSSGAVDVAFPWTIYGSCAELAAAVEKLPDRVHRASNDKWCGGSVADCFRILRDGDLDAVPDASKYADMINDAVELAGVRSEWSPDVVGAFPSVPAFLAGDPCSMLARSPVQDERGEIGVYVNVCASESLSALELRRRGVCVLAAVLALSRVRSVRLVVYSSAGFGPFAVRCSYPLDVSEVCGLIACPVSFRRALLALSIDRSIRNGAGGSCGWCPWSEVKGGNERTEVRRELGDGGPALVITPHKLGSWAGLSDRQFVEKLNGMIEAVNAGGDLDAATL